MSKPLNLKETLKLFKAKKTIPVKNPLEAFGIYSQKQKEEKKNHDARNLPEDPRATKEETA